LARHIIVNGLGFGDEGKGALIDFLAWKYLPKTVIRYNGGSQAAHHVVKKDGRFHRFSQFTSGTLHSSASSILSAFMTFDPFALDHEARKLQELLQQNPRDRLQVCSASPVVTPFHRILNRIRELLRFDQRHGSCGSGMGELFYDRLYIPDSVIQVGDLLQLPLFQEKLKQIQHQKKQQAELLIKSSPTTPSSREAISLLYDISNADLFDSRLAFYRTFSENYRSSISKGAVANFLLQSKEEDTILWEGAQGALLDQDFGFFPHVSPSSCRDANAIELIENHNKKSNKLTIGVIRAYMTRHGAGPFPTEDTTLKKIFPEKHNQNSPWQGELRRGWLDLVAIRYSISMQQQPILVTITHLDYLILLKVYKICVAYRIDLDIAHRILSQDESEHDGLDVFFKGYPSGNFFEISDINLPQKSVTQNQTLLMLRTRLLQHCQPKFIEFPLPKTASLTKPEEYLQKKEIQDLLSFLAGRAGLNAPIAMVSFGPTRHDFIPLIQI